MPAFIGAVLGALMISQLRRSCPNCGAEVVVRLEEKNQAINCVHCGASIPPKDSGDTNAH